MRKIILFIFVCFAFLFSQNAISQVSVANNGNTVTTNKGTEFWVGYGHHQYMEATYTNDQNMTLYFNVNDLPFGVSFATVTVTIDSSGPTPAFWWKRVYHIPVNTTISIDNATTPAYSYSPSNALAWGPLPKGSINASASNTSSSYDARLFTEPFPAGTSSEGLFRKKGIHIQSDYPINAYAHIYGNQNSGATMLLPVASWGLKYTTINSRQANADHSFNFFYAMASQDNTPIKIVPSQISRLGKLARTPIYVTLQKGQTYQYVGNADSAGNGVQLTGSIIESLDPTKPIAVFAGCSRTEGENVGCAASSRDNDMQQCFPQETWGTAFLTAPFSSANIATTITPSILTGCIYKVIARDSGTVVTINDTLSFHLKQGYFYQFNNDAANHIVANKPIMVAQFMASQNCSNGLGDPEIIYLNPIERGVKQIGFYRNNKQIIDVNYLTLIVPNDGLSSLTIDGLPYNNGLYTYNYPHPNISNYTVVVKGWTAAQAQCIVKCDKRFTGITYGLGSAESYGYSIGANFYLNTPNANPYAKPRIKGIVFCDMNSNGVKDGNDFAKANVKIELSNGTYTFSDINGYYEIDADSLGLYTTTPTAPNFFAAIPTSNTYIFNSYDTTVTSNFALQQTVVKDSVSINVIPFFMNAVAGNPYPYFVEYENVGSTVLSPNIGLINNNYLLLYDSCTDINSVPMATGIFTSAINMQPGEIKNFIPYFTIRSSANNGDTLQTKYTIIANTASVIDSFYTIITGGDSTNAQRATKAISPAQITKGKSIEYIINFRNTNTYSIKDLRITDTLSDLLQSGTVEILNASHPCKALVKGKVILFEFLDINLPDMYSNQFKSLGYLKFRVKPKNSLVVGDIITNKISLYFDYDNPIITAPASTVVNATGILPVKIGSYTSILQYEKQVLNTWQTINEINVIQFNIQRSLNGKDFNSIAKIEAKGAGEYKFLDNQLPTVNSKTIIYYRLEIIDNDGSKSYSIVKQITLNPINLKGLNIYPNPTKNIVNIECANAKEITIVDYLGKQLISKKTQQNQPTIINIQSLNKGIYFVRVTTINGDIKNEKLVIE